MRRDGGSVLRIALLLRLVAALAIGLLHAKASPFWIILLLVWANPEHLEPLTLNQRVPGSSPGAPTTGCFF